MIHNIIVAQSLFGAPYGREVCCMFSRDFVLAVMASVVAYYLVKCLDLAITLIMGS